ncbi:hypothetical protein ACC731_37460, partial [Rhizobium ruizarguesonis]
KAAGIKFFAPGDLTQESDLPALGDSALGIQTTFHYAVSHDSPENKAFVEAATKAICNKAELSFPSVSAYDGLLSILLAAGRLDHLVDDIHAVIG